MSLFNSELDAELSALSSRISAIILADLQKHDPSIKNYHISLAPSALEKTDEEIIESVKDMIHVAKVEIDAWNKKSEAEKLLNYVERMYTALKTIGDVCKTDLSEMSTWNANEMYVKGKIFDIVEGTLLTINNTDTFKRYK